jgi:hypothetical protein
MKEKQTWRSKKGVSSKQTGNIIDKCCLYMFILQNLGNPRECNKTMVEWI